MKPSLSYTKYCLCGPDTKDLKYNLPWISTFPNFRIVRGTFLLQKENTYEWIAYCNRPYNYIKPTVNLSSYSLALSQNNLYDLLLLPSCSNISLSLIAPMSSANLLQFFLFKPSTINEVFLLNQIHATIACHSGEGAGLESSKIQG